MKKLLLLTKTLLAAVLLCVGQNAWGGTKNLYSQDFQSFAVDANFNTVPGFWQYAGASVQKIVESSGNKYLTYQPGTSTRNAAINFNISSFSAGDNWTVSFDASMAAGNKDGGMFLAIVGAKGTATATNGWGQSTGNLFSVATSVASSESYTVNVGANTLGDAITLTSGSYYHYVLNWDGTNINLTITKDGEVTPTLSTSKAYSSSDNTTYGNPAAIYWVTTRNYGITNIDNILVTEDVDEEFVSAPSIAVAYAGANRTVTITGGTSSDSNPVTTYYTTDGSTPTSSSSVYSAALDISSNCTVKAITISNKGTFSDIASEEVTVGKLTLNAPTINLTGMTASAGVYNPTYSFTSNQAGIAGNPTATLSYSFAGGASTAGTSYTPTTTGTLTVTASADGYNSAQSMITVSKVGFVLTNTINTADLYGDYASNGNLEWPTGLDYELIPNVTFDPISNTQGCTYRTTHSPTVYNALYARNKAFTATCSGLTEDMIVLFGDYQNNILKPITSTDNSVTIGKDGTLKYYYLYVQPTYKQAITISDAEWKTLCSPYSLDFTGISGIKAYIVTGVETDGRTLSLTQVNKVPAGTGVLLSGAADTYNIPVISESAATDDVSGNKLVGVVANKVKDANSIYVLMADPKVGFYKNANAFTVGANTAYLPADFAGLARSAFFFGGNITAVDNVEAAAEAKAKDGKFIENGKLVIIKNGQKFNAAGAKLY